MKMVLKVEAPDLMYMSAIDVPASQQGTGVSVITSAEIRDRNEAQTVDLMRELPGMVFAQDGARGSLADLFVRGGSSNYNLVELNGIRLARRPLGSGQHQQRGQKTEDDDRNRIVARTILVLKLPVQPRPRSISVAPARVRDWAAARIQSWLASSFTRTALALAARMEFQTGW